MSDRLGIGAMIGLLGGNRESVEAFQSAIGKTITALRLDPESDGAVVFELDNGRELRLADDGRSCCESRYLTCDDDLAAFVGATLQSAEVRDGPRVESQYDDEHEQMFLVVTTSKGQFTVAAHNEHNGYYGGILIRASIK